MAKDIILDDDDDLLFSNGDLVVGESGEQEISLLMRSNQGDWRASPLTGFGLSRRTKNEINRTQFERALSAELEQDGFTGVVVDMSPTNGLTISAKRND